MKLKKSKLTHQVQGLIETVIPTKVGISRMLSLNIQKVQIFIFVLLRVLFRCIEEIPTFVGMTDFIWSF